jgi:hypothetical protein
LTGSSTPLNKSIHSVLEEFIQLNCVQCLY